MQPTPVSGLWSVPALLTPFLGPPATAGLVVVLVVFMLLGRKDLRNRLIRLFGHGRVATTTRAFDEAGRRVSRYLLVQSFVNLVFGIGVGVGLFPIGLPYAVLWAALAAALRFIPYVGPIAGAGAPILVALAALEGWTRPFMVLGLFVALELFTNMVLETVLYAGAVGMSQVAVLIAVAFWSWLWGPVGLLLATPLTVCLAVMGKYVPGLEFLTTLVSDAPVLTPDVVYYQRLLAGDAAEAGDLLERHPPDDGRNVYNAMMLPALSYAERDLIEDYRAICIADLPPSPASRSRYLVKRLRALAPELPILVGRFAPPALADDDTTALTAAGVTALSTSLAECREQLLRLTATPDATAVSAA